MAEGKDVAKDVGGGAIGAGVGGLQVYALRTYADTPGTPLIAKLGNWGYPSALVDLIVGAVGTAVGAISYWKGKPVGSKPLAAAITGYGITTLAGGIYSGVKPVATATPTGAPQRLATPTGAPQRLAEPQVQAARQAAAAQNALRVVPTAAERKGGIVIQSLSQ